MWLHDSEFRVYRGKAVRLPKEGMTKKKRERTMSILSSSLLLEAPASKSERFKSGRLHYPYDMCIAKNGYAVPLDTLNAADDYTIIGCESEVCVLATAFQFYNIGYDFHILKDYIFTNNENPVINDAVVENLYSRQFGNVLQ